MRDILPRGEPRKKAPRGGAIYRGEPEKREGKGKERPSFVTGAAVFCAAMKTAFALLLAVFTASIAFAGNSALTRFAAVRYAPPSYCPPQPICQPPPPPAPTVPAGGHVLTVGQYFHIKHSEYTILALSAERAGRIDEAKRYTAAAAQQIVFLDQFRAELDKPYIGSL